MAKDIKKGVIRIDGLDLEKTHVWIDPPGKPQAFGMPILDFAKIMERVISDGNVYLTVISRNFNKSSYGDFKYPYDNKNKIIFHFIFLIYYTI